MTTVSLEMTRKVVYALESDDLAQVFNSMKALGIHHVPVTRDGQLVGILSDRDILIHATKGKYGNVSVPKKKVAEAMSTQVKSCRPQDSIADIADMMLKHHIHAVPVVNDEHFLLGIISTTDLIRLLRTKGVEDWKEIPFTFAKAELISEISH